MAEPYSLAESIRLAAERGVEKRWLAAYTKARHGAMEAQQS